MAHESFKNVLDSLDYTFVDSNIHYLRIDNLETIRDFLLSKRDHEYKHIDMTILPCIFFGILFL